MRRKEATNHLFFFQNRAITLNAINSLCHISATQVAVQCLLCYLLRYDFQHAVARLKECADVSRNKAMPMPLDMENKTQWNITATSLTIFSRSLYRSKEKLNCTSCQCFLRGPLPPHNTSISYFRNVHHNRFIPAENVRIYYVVNSNIYRFGLNEKNEKFYTSAYLSLAFVFFYDSISATVFSKTVRSLRNYDQERITLEFLF